ncbi:protein kinase domain-containing protein [Citrus sinensis]|nr:protein kinase domain-containing protein [Citrus sinensis]
MATDGFHRIVYTNSHGAAYKARFQDGEVALVKEIQALNLEKDAFYREIQLLGRLHHRHLLALQGFSTGRKRLLVFDNIENGSLKEHLNDPLKTPLDWKTRLQIAIGVAAALEYLLLFSNLPMYYVSISSSSIMLDENFTAKLSDVGFFNSVRNYATMPHSSCPEGNNIILSTTWLTRSNMSVVTYSSIFLCRLFDSGLQQHNISARCANSGASNRPITRGGGC